MSERDSRKRAAEPGARETSLEPPASTEPTRRWPSIDVLRGFSVLAIFATNVKMMANGFNHYRDTSLWSGEAAQVIGLLQSRLIDGKFVTIFSALFGAGLVLLRSKTIPVPFPIVLRRLVWLGLFGGIHLIFLREGDILIWYAMAGVLAVPFVSLPARTLFVIGLALEVAVFVYFTRFPISETEAPILWRNTPEQHHAVAEIILGPIHGHIAARLDAAEYYIIDLFLVGGVWIDTLALMLLGMALVKSRFLTAELSHRTYAIWGAVGLLVASAYFILRPLLPPEGLGGIVVSVARYAHRFGGSLAWCALVMGAMAAGTQARRLAAVGRMAFTVYILQSVIGLLLFSSLGLGLFGQLSLPALMLVTVAVWTLFLVVTPWWLACFRFGPLEWVWRALTYGKKPAFRAETN